MCQGSIKTNNTQLLTNNNQPAKIAKLQSPMTQQLISNNQIQLTKQLLQSNLRLDGRGPIKERNLSIQFLSKPGHLLYHFGGTVVLVKTFLELTAPKEERPSEGFVVFRLDCHSCQDTFDQNKKLSVELTKLLEKNIIGSNCLDPQSLCIVTGKYVWKLQLNFTVVNDDGNVIDAVLNSSVIALMDMRKPMVNVQRNEIAINQKKLQMLSVAHLPISMSFFFVENNIFVDATHLEEQVGLTRITITMNIYKQICSIHKPGGMGLDQETISGTVRILQQKVKEKTEKMREIVKARNRQWVK